MAKLFPRPASLGKPLSAEAVERVHRAIADGSAKVLRSASLTGFNRQQAHVLSVLERPIIAGVDVNVGKKASTVDPLVRVLRTGFVVEVRPKLVGDGKNIGLDLLALIVSADEPRTVFYRKDEPYVVHEYRTKAANVLTNVVLPDGGTLAFSRGAPPARPGHRLVYLVTARSTDVSGRE
jgi:hypothetical protein